MALSIKRREGERGNPATEVATVHRAAAAHNLKRRRLSSAGKRTNFYFRDAIVREPHEQTHIHTSPWAPATTLSSCCTASLLRQPRLYGFRGGHHFREEVAAREVCREATRQPVQPAGAPTIIISRLSHHPSHTRARCSTRPGGSLRSCRSLRRLRCLQTRGSPCTSRVRSQHSRERTHPRTTSRSREGKSGTCSWPLPLRPREAAPARGTRRMLLPAPCKACLGKGAAELEGLCIPHADVLAGDQDRLESWEHLHQEQLGRGRERPSPEVALIEFGAAEVDGLQGSRVMQGPEATAVDLAAAHERDGHHVVLGVHTLKEAGETLLGPERAVIHHLAQVLRAGTEADEARHWEQLAAVE
eukprot:scaffold113_cov59-Phaeocystis_antarctica.AAC.2